MQAHEFEVRLPIPYAEIVKNYAPEQYREAQGRFIKIAGRTVHSKNTFLHVMDSTVGENTDRELRKSASNPLLLNYSSSCPPPEEPPSSDPIEDSTKDYPSQSDSCERDVSADSADKSGSRGSSSDEACQNYPGELKSVGSAGHPDRCTECSFYFFGTQGCTKGSDCRFCHEFHPRKNSRKNRRLLKRLTVGDSSIPEEQHTGESSNQSATVEPSTERSGSEDVDLVFSPEKRTDAASAAGVSQAPGTSHSLSASSVAVNIAATAVPASSSSAKALAEANAISSWALEQGGKDIGKVSPEIIKAAVPYSFGTSAVMSVRYLRHGPEKRQAKLTLAVGQEVHLPAWVGMDSSARKALQNVLTFSVDPPLQHGLSLDPQNGLISGMATEVQARKLHMITASTAATGPGGIRLGLVPLARTSLLIRIVDLRKLKASWVCEADGDGDERILVEFKVPSAGDGGRHKDSRSSSPGSRGSGSRG